MADMLIDGSPVRTPERVTEPKRDLDTSASVVHGYIAPAPGRHIPHMLLATTLVAVLPLIVSLALRASGVVSGWVSVGLAVVMSLVSSTAGSTYWRKRGHSEVLFGELLLWGWIRSWRQERELANATRLLGLVHPGPALGDELDELSVEQREHLLRQLAGALEGQDVYLNGHSRRVARHATMIARGMGLSNEDVARVRAAAAVHDVGKLLTPKAILNKPGRLTEAEFEVIKLHPVDGAEMVAALGDPELTRIVRHHHERLDGNGYPGRLEGEEIPVGARIIAVADTFDAITSARPYREAAPHQKAIDILRKEAGTQLDPDAVRSFLAYYSGSRPTVIWAIITSSLRRIVSWLSGDPAAAATISASKVAAATAATAAIGAAAGAAPVPVVHHHPSRPAVVHNVPSSTRGAARSLSRHGVSVLVPSVSPAPVKHAGRTPKAAPAKAHRGRASHVAARSRNHAKPSGGRQAHSRRAAGARASSRSAARSPAGAASGTAGTPATRSPGTTAGQSTGNPSVIAADPSATAPAHPAPASQPQRAPGNQSQGSNANGNAYGHDKVLGNGHGNGLAKGHGNSSARSSPAAPPVHVPVPVPAPSPAESQHGSDGNNGNGQGNDHANPQANNNGQGHGNGNSQGDASASAIIAPTTSDANAGSQDNGNGQGNGAHGHGHDG